MTHSWLLAVVLRSSLYRMACCLPTTGCDLRVPFVKDYALRNEAVFLCTATISMGKLSPINRYLPCTAMLDYRLPCLLSPDTRQSDPRHIAWPRQIYHTRNAKPPLRLFDTIPTGYALRLQTDNQQTAAHLRSSEPLLVYHLQTNLTNHIQKPDPFYTAIRSL